MSKVILYIATSLDGFIARPDGDISWLESYQSPDEDHGYQEFYAGIGTVIMGWNTYEKALSLPGGIDAAMPTYVVSSMGAHEKHANLQFVSGTNLGPLVAELRSKTEKDIWLVGGGQLVQSFLKEGLVDEIILSTIPCILGSGLSLFGNLGQTILLSTLSTKKYPDGIVATHYQITNGAR